MKKNITALILLLCLSVQGASMRFSDYPNTTTLSNFFLFLVASPTNATYPTGTNYNIRVDQIIPALAPFGIAGTGATHLGFVSVDGTSLIINGAGQMSASGSSAATNVFYSAALAGGGIVIQTNVPANYVYTFSLDPGVSNQWRLDATNAAAATTNILDATKLTGIVPNASLAGITSNNFDAGTKAQLALATSTIGSNQIAGVISNTTAGPLTNHSDVLGGALTSGDVIGWNALTGKWTNGPPAAGAPINGPTFGPQFGSANGFTNIAGGASLTNIDFDFHGTNQIRFTGANGFYSWIWKSGRLYLTNNIDGTYWDFNHGLAIGYSGDGSMLFDLADGTIRGATYYGNGWNITNINGANIIGTVTIGQTNGPIKAAIAADTGVFSGDASGLTNANATTLFGNGTVPDARLSANVALYSGTVSNALNAINALPLAGGTMSGAVLTTSATSNAPSATELATAGWVRSLLGGGFIYYTTTNIDAAATNNDTAGQPVYKFEGAIPASASRQYVNPAAGTYIGSVMTTNTFTFLDSPVSTYAYMALSTGGSDAITVKPELYISYDKTNWTGDFDCNAQAVAKGVTNLYSFVISFPAQTATNSTGFYVERRFKVVSAAGTPTLTFLVGTNIASGTNSASHISLQGPNSASGNAYLANNQTFTGTNTFSVAIAGNITGNAATATAAAGAAWLTGNQTVTLSGDATGSGATAITATVSNILASTGSAGQVLTKTATGNAWSNAPSGTGTLTGVTNTGGGISLINNSNSPVPIFKSVTNGANITLTDNGTNVSIASTASGSGGGTNSGPIVLSASGTNVTVDCTTPAGAVTNAPLTFRLLMTGNWLISLTNANDGQRVELVLTQDGTGSRVPSWNTSGATNCYGTDITGITLSTTANKTDHLLFEYWAASNRFDVVGFVRGY